MLLLWVWAFYEPYDGGGTRYHEVAEQTEDDLLLIWEANQDADVR